MSRDPNLQFQVDTYRKFFAEESGEEVPYDPDNHHRTYIHEQSFAAVAAKPENE